MVSSRANFRETPPKPSPQAGRAYQIPINQLKSGTQTPRPACEGSELWLAKARQQAKENDRRESGPGVGFLEGLGAPQPGMGVTLLRYLIFEYS